MQKTNSILRKEAVKERESGEGKEGETMETRKKCKTRGEGGGKEAERRLVGV